MRNSTTREFILRSIAEDLGDGDHSSMACIPQEAKGKAKLLIKEKGILAGVRVTREIFNEIDDELECDILIGDGNEINQGDIAFYLSGRQQSILKSERLVLNIMQRMSGIASSTNQYITRMAGTKTKILDTRKTTPGFRFLEKEAVRIGGGLNHRMGLFDMIMLKDNHIVYAGGIEKAIKKTREYLKRTNRKLEIGICGEHGGDPNSIEWCHIIGLNYVSCSPFRVPIARLAAAHAALK